MKKLKLLLIALISPVIIYSQGVEVVPFVGYMFGGSVKYVEGKLKIDNGMDYGLSLLIPVESILDVELNYTRMESKAAFTPYAGYPGYQYRETNAATNYFQIGAIKKFMDQGSKAVPFGSFSLGATWFHAMDNETYYQDKWRFSITLGLGVKVMFSDRVGIMLRGRFMMPMTFAGAGFYVGGGGSGVTMNSWVAPLQGDFNGGLIIKLGD
jgi:hypothetical protein